MHMSSPCPSLAAALQQLPMQDPGAPVDPVPASESNQYEAYIESKQALGDALTSKTRSSYDCDVGKV